MTSWKDWVRRNAVAMAISLCLSLVPIGCAIRSASLQRRFGDVTRNSTPLRQGEPAPQDGWLVPPADFAYLLRCADWIEAEGKKVD